MFLRLFAYLFVCALECPIDGVEILLCSRFYVVIQDNYLRFAIFLLRR